MVDGLDDSLVARCREVLLAARVREPAVRDSSALPDPDEVAALALRELAHYDTPDRHHHTTRHLAEVFDEIDRLVALDGRWGEVPLSVQLAVLFHDVVYDPTRDDNEQRSAQHARARLADLGVARPMRDEVARLTWLTTTHDPDPDDPPGHLLVDGDLWILAAPRERYGQYVEQVRAEYVGLDDEQWRRGRLAVLARLAKQVDQHGYRVGPFEDRARRTVAALDNIDRERATLDGWSASD